MSAEAGKQVGIPRSEDMQGKYRSVVRQFLVWMMPIIGVVAFAGGAAVLIVEYNHDIEIMEDQFLHIEETQAGLLSGLIVNGDDAQLMREMKGIREMPFITYVALQRADGVHLLAQGVRRQGRLIDEREFAILTGVAGEADSLLVQADRAVILGRIVDLAIIIGVAQLLTALAFMLALIVVFHRLVGRHLRLMAQQARRFSLDRLDRPIRLDRSTVCRDELSELSDAFAELHRNARSGVVEFHQAMEALNEALEALETQQKFGQTLVASSPIGIVVARYDGTIVDANPASLHLLELQMSQAIGDNIGRYINIGEDNAPVAVVSATGVESRLLVQQISLVISRQTIYFLSDVTELQRYREELEDLVAIRTQALEEAQKQLAATAHAAGMSDIMRNMMHFYGNVMNVAAVSVERMRSSVVNTDFSVIFMRLLAKLPINDCSGEIRALILSVSSKLQGRRKSWIVDANNACSAIENMNLVINRSDVGMIDYVETVDFDQLVTEVSQEFSVPYESPGPILFAFHPHKARLILEAMMRFHLDKPSRVTLSEEGGHAVVRLWLPGPLDEQEVIRLFSMQAAIQVGDNPVYSLHMAANFAIEMKGRLLFEGGKAPCLALMLTTNKQAISA